MAVASLFGDIARSALAFLPLVFFGLIIYLLWRSLQYMPRVKPPRVEAAATSNIRWDDVAGAEEAKAELQEVADFLRPPKRFSRLGARVPKGMLLYGPPGTGKTLLAKAVAHESGAKFYSQSASAFVEMFAGVGASRIRKLFEEARRNAPAIVFIDELDAVGTARNGGGFNREHDQTLNQLLVELDGFDETAQVVVMGASNRLQDLDPALLRPGRFGRKELSAIGMEHFEAAMERVLAGLQQRRVVTEKEKRILAYHEGGHALMAHLMGDLLPIQKV